MSSISTWASRGSAFTATVVRAGYGLLKRLPYAPFMAGKLAMSVRYTLHLITWSMDRPASLSALSRLSKQRCVWASTSPLINSPVAGSSGVWPERYSRSPAQTPTEYGPMAAGALELSTIFLVIRRKLQEIRDTRQETAPISYVLSPIAFKPPQL